jgi:hypothetical protein
MICATFIADGYTQPGYIQPVDRLHDAMRFRFRPVLIEERSRLSDLATTVSSAGYLRQMAALLAEKLVTWDVTDHLGNEVEVSAANLLRLQPELLLKLERIVLGVLPSDVDPRWSAEQINRLTDEEFVAATAGCTIGEARQQESEKN